MKKAFGIMILSLLFIGMILSPARTPTASAASQTSINTAITKGLAYLNRTQSSNGEWSSSNYPVASTAMAVLAFENAPNSHYGWNATDPYNTTVQNGLDWLFSQASVIAISSSDSAGNPDTNLNGIGIGWLVDSEPVYETPMVLMAIIASNAQTNVTTTGPANVFNRTYHDIAQDVVDWIAWAQNSVPGDGVYEGGWRYQPQEGDSDNSVSQWPVMGLMAAELWNINASPWVQTELLKWTNTMQNLTGNSNTNPYYGAFDYQLTGGNHNLYTPTETAAGILELTYCGVNDTDSRIVAAEGYLNRDWNPNGNSPGWGFGFNWNIGDLYDMYAVMKACRLTTPNSTQFVANYNGTPGVEWYNGTGEYADALVTNQSADGHWNNWVAPLGDSDEVSDALGTAWGTLILEFVPVKVLYNLVVHVVNACTNSSVPSATVAISGPESLWNTTDGSGNAVFEMIQAGSYQVDASAFGYVPSATYTVPVTSNTIFNISLDPLPPIVTISPSNSTIAVGGSVFFTSNVSGGTAPYSYQWYLDGAPVSGATSASWTFTPTSEGLYFVSLKVTDANDNIVYSNTAQVTVITVPVGGYSVSLAKHTSSIQMPAYTALISLFAAAVIVVKRKRK